MSVCPSRRAPLAALIAAAVFAVVQPAQAQVGAPAPAASAAAQSPLDGQLLYQLLVAEMALQNDDVATAYEWTVAAARRTRDEELFKRAIEIALRTRAGDKALAAAQAWRLASPGSLEAMRVQLQIALALNRNDALAEPLKAMLAATPEAERAALLAALPRFLRRASDTRAIATLIETVVAPYRDRPATKAAARVAVGRAWLEAHDIDRALALAREAQSVDPAAPGPSLLAMELMRTRPQSEEIVLRYLDRPDAEPAIRLAYVRLLTGGQRYADAVAQLETAVRRQPEVAAPYLSLGALYLELKRPQQGEAALLRYVELAQRLAPAAADAPRAGARPGGAAAAAASDAAAGRTGAVAGADRGDGNDDDARGEAAAPGNEQGLMQAWLMLAQSAEQRGDFKAAEAWLAKVDDPKRALDVQSRRASILARQGRVDEARELLRKAPERNADDRRAKLVAEAAMLREVKRWRDAFDVLAQASAAFPDETDLMYEQAMMAEKLERLPEMERLLRRVIELKPDNAHAHNALGYSLADRSVRLPEARDLIRRALEIAPGDPFITDSLGWVEYRMGNLDEAARLLKQAYAARPDPEIGAHLGEVLWAKGQRDEARRVWNEARGRDAGNDVLRETLSRLRVEL